MAVLRERPDDGDELLGTQRAVHADDVGSHGVEDDRRRLRIRARDRAAIFAVGELADHGDVRDLLCREQGSAHLLDVDAGLDDEIVRTRIGEGFGLLPERGVRLLEVEIAKRCDETARRPHGACDLRAAGSGFLRELHGGRVELHDAVLQAVVVEFQAAGTKGVRLDDRGTGIDVGTVDVLDDLGVLDVHAFGAGAGGEAAGLQHSAHGTVENMDHRDTPLLFYFFLDGQL